MTLGSFRCGSSCALMKPIGIYRVLGRSEQPFACLVLASSSEGDLAEAGERIAHVGRVVNRQTALPLESM